MRALEPWPKTFTYWLRAGGQPLRLILGKAHAVPAPKNSAAGVVLEAVGDTLVIGTGDGGLKIESIQPAGKKLLGTAEFLRGYPVGVGDRFGAEPAS